MKNVMMDGIQSRAEQKERNVEQHLALNKLLALYHASQLDGLSREKSHELFGDFFNVFRQHLASDEAALVSYTDKLKDECKLFNDQVGRDLEEITEDTLALMQSNSTDVSKIIPKLEALVAKHEAQRAHQFIIR